MLTTVADVFLFFATWIIIIPVVTGTLRYGNLSKECRIIFFFTIIACITEITSYITRSRGINNMPLLHIYTVIEFVIISWFYHLLFKRIFSFSPLPLIAVLFVIGSIINSLWIQEILSFNSYIRGIEAVLIILYALIILYVFFFQPDAKKTVDDPVFWINAGILIYFSGATTLFILSNYILPLGYQFNKNIWGVHALLSIIMYLSITTGLWKSKTR